MMATVPHVISGLGLRKFQADGFLLTRVYQLTFLQETLDGFPQQWEAHLTASFRHIKFRNILYLNKTVPYINPVIP